MIQHKKPLPQQQQKLYLHPFLERWPQLQHIALFLWQLFSTSLIRSTLSLGLIGTPSLKLYYTDSLFCYPFFFIFFSEAGVFVWFCEFQVGSYCTDSIFYQNSSFPTHVTSAEDCY
jgi:hypothetical protein